MIVKYFLTHMKILYTDKLTIVMTALSIGVFFLFVSSMSAIVSSDQVIVGLEARNPSKFVDLIEEKLLEDDQTQVVKVPLDEAKLLIENGKMDIYIDLDEEIDAKIKDGEYESLVHFYTGGISLYSVFYPEMIFGTMIKEVHLAVVNRYVDNLSEKKNAFLEKESFNEIKDEYNEVFDSRGGDYFFNIDVEEDIALVKMKELSPQKLFYLNRIIGVLMILLNLYIMVVIGKSVEEHEYGVASRIHTTPVGTATVMLGRWLVGVLPAVVISFFASMILVPKEASFTSLLGVFATLVWISVILVLLMMVLGQFFKETHRYIIVSVFLIMIFGVISGVFFDIDLLPGGELIKAISPYGKAIDRILGIILEVG